MYCTKCGVSNPVDATFCGQCGQNLSNSGDPVGEPLGMVGFISAIKLGYENYVNFKERATRAEFWWFYLFAMIVNILLLVLTTVILDVMFGYLTIFFVTLIPLLSAAVRRLHDRGKSGWWCLLYFVPFGGLVLLVWFIMKGDSGSNKYGPDRMYVR
tara:strand:+ start:221 stop:688 length:468 start_codon:yes stop_codon:yes gene_type:complete